MPRRKDIQKIMVVGSGPIVIGQACEFDYSGTQALKALRQEGYKTVLVNSNPATIMTDPDLADRTYIEPLTLDALELIIAKERPDAFLPTVGGQTALNLTMELSEKGVFEKYEVEVLGANPETIHLAEDRDSFCQAMKDIKLSVAKGKQVGSVEEALDFAQQSGFPVVIRPSFTLGGSGGGIARNEDEIKEIAVRGLRLSRTHEVLIEESLIGWKEYELEVIRDKADNVIVVCSIENIDAMGVHTGDSITVAPAQTLSDKEYQRLRNAAVAILRRVKVDTGGANVQFAIDPASGRMVVIEMNPRVSRSSALASKATGYPIAKVAAKLAVGYTLDELPNDITINTPAAFEPALDYVVTKIPKFTFEKFPGSDMTLGTQMKSVGEVMAIGRTLRESLFKALRSLESLAPHRPGTLSEEHLSELLSKPSENTLRFVVNAFERGWDIDRVARLTFIDPWFLEQVQAFSRIQQEIRHLSLEDLGSDLLRMAKENGFSDRRIAYLCGSTSKQVRDRRKAEGILPVYKQVDTCAGEFVARTPYLYSSYEEEDECLPDDTEKVLIIGSGPNRIGQGIEFDYCACHAAFAVRELGLESVLINCNPETVSTDYDTSDRLYFEPLTVEDVLAVIEREKPKGVVVQFGGQTPLNLTGPLASAGVPILGTPPDKIDLCEDRQRFNQHLDRLNIDYPAHAFASNIEEAKLAVAKIGFPVLVRPSYVIGGRAMAVIYKEQDLEYFLSGALAASRESHILIDCFLEDAFEVDVDALCDGRDCVVAGIMQHVEEAGVHSGDSSCVLPTYNISEEHLGEIRKITKTLALSLEVVGLINIQFAIAEGKLYVLEVNPRASRTVPFLAKATGLPLAKIATRLMMGNSLKSMGLSADLEVDRFYVKTPVFPFAKFPGSDPIASVEMRSTGEVMGSADSMGMAFFKAQLAAGISLPKAGKALITVNDRDHDNVVPIAKRLSDAGFMLCATRGTALTLRASNLRVEEVQKHGEGEPDCVDAIRQGEIDLIINTPLGGESHRDGVALRQMALEKEVPFITTLSGAAAAVDAIEALKRGETFEVVCLQELHHG